jgi:hypothetical protein
MHFADEHDSMIRITIRESLFCSRDVLEGAVNCEFTDFTERFESMAYFSFKIIWNVRTCVLRCVTKIHLSFCTIEDGNERVMQENVNDFGSVWLVLLYVFVAIN